MAPAPSSAEAILAAAGATGNAAAILLIPTIATCSRSAFEQMAANFVS